jgi:hypothetical protein
MTPRNIGIGIGILIIIVVLIGLLARKKSRSED